MLYTTIGSVHKIVNYHLVAYSIKHYKTELYHERFASESFVLFYSIYHITLQQVRLHFVRSMLGVDDYIEIHDGNSSTSRLMHTFNSGDNIPSYIVSSGNTLFVSFHAASHNTYSDFLVEYNATECEYER